MKEKYKLLRLGRQALITIVLLCVCISSFPAAPVGDEASDAGTENIGSEISSTDAGLAALSEQGYILTHENQALQLYCATSGDHTGTFAVINKADGQIWYSNPLDAADDPVSLKITLMQSLLSITYHDEENDTMVTLNSKADSVDMDGLNLQKLKNGLRFNFTFPAVDITVPFTVLLNDDGSMTAKIAVDAIEERSSYDLFSVSMLPYFCAASDKDKGFALIPDGSGAVMTLNNGKTAYSAYSQPVYGGDAGEIAKSEVTTQEKIYMPVFGLQKNGSAMFTVITEGAAQSTVNAAVSGVESGYNTVWNDFSVRKVTNYSLDQGWQGTKTFNVYQETEPTIQTLENRYWFLSGDDADLSGMASVYRDYLKLQSNSSVEQGAASVYIDYLGAVTRKKSVLGFPVNVKMTATAFDEALTITQKLVENGVNQLNLRYMEWDKRSVEGKIPDKAVPESDLGGKKDFLELAAYASEQNIGFYPDIDLTTFTRTNYPFQQYFDVTRNMNREVNRYYPYKRNLFTQDQNRDSWYVINFQKLEKTAASFLKSYQKLGISGLSLSAISGTVTSDYSNKNNQVEPWAGAQKYHDLIKELSKKNDLMLDEAFFPNAVYAKELVNLPETSKFDMLDYGVPFYQMVISGAISYTGKAINLSDDPDLALLKVMETGGNLHYSLNYHSESEVVKGTAYDSWIGSDYAKWLPTIQAQYQELQEVYTKLGSRKLIGYEKRKSGLTVSYFEGGGELWINTSDSTVTDGPVKAEPKSYVIRKAGMILEKD